MNTIYLKAQEAYELTFFAAWDSVLSRMNIEPIFGRKIAADNGSEIAFDRLPKLMAYS